MEVHPVALAVHDDVPVPGVVPREGQDVPQHQVERHHHLYGSLHTARDAVRHSGEHLQSGHLHVVVRGGDGEADVPDIDEVADSGDKRVDEQTEQDYKDELVPSGLQRGNGLKYFNITAITFLIVASTVASSPKN